MDKGMSNMYQDKITELIKWFDARIKYMEPLEITQSEYSLGVDCLSGKYIELRVDAFSELLTNGCELSYNQVCNAFFASARKNGKLIIKA